LKPFDELTYRGQVERLRLLGEAALREFGVRAPALRHIAPRGASEGLPRARTCLAGTC
jgi:hypothetical protein